MAAHTSKVTRSVRHLAAAAALTVSAVVGPVGSAHAGTVYLCDQPHFDEPEPTADILCTTVTFDRRVVVNTEFTIIGPSSPGADGPDTVYTAMLDPARKRVGPRFLLAVRGDRTATTGTLSMATSVHASFTRVRCADIRTRVISGSDNMVVSIPSQCLRRHTKLGQGLHVRLRSYTPGGGDFLPDRPATFRVPRG